MALSSRLKASAKYERCASVSLFTETCEERSRSRGRTVLLVPAFTKCERVSGQIFFVVKVQSKVKQTRGVLHWITTLSIGGTEVRDLYRSCASAVSVPRPKMVQTLSHVQNTTWLSINPCLHATDSSSPHSHNPFHTTPSLLLLLGTLLLMSPLATSSCFQRLLAGGSSSAFRLPGNGSPEFM